MSEVQGESNTNNPSTGLIHPVGAAIMNKNSERPLETNAPTLHPLPKSQPIVEKPKIQFDSTVGSKNSQKADLFAEQNAKRAEKDKKRKKSQKKAIIAGSIIGGLAIIGVIAWIVITFYSNHTDSPEAEPTVVFSEDNVTDDMNKLQNLAFEAYKPTAELGPDGETIVTGTLSSAEQVFDRVQSDPRNEEYTSQINVSKIIFYVNNGFYNLAIENIDKVNIDDLAPVQRVAFYNYVSIAYYSTNDKEKSSEYTKLAQEEAMQLGGVGG